MADEYAQQEWIIDRVMSGYYTNLQRSSTLSSTEDDDDDPDDLDDDQMTSGDGVDALIGDLEDLKQFARIEGRIDGYIEAAHDLSRMAQDKFAKSLAEM